MKKIFIILTVVLLIAFMCSCNSDLDKSDDENTTAEVLNNITQDADNEDNRTNTEETTQRKIPIVYENLVYTNIDVDKIINVDANVQIKEIPEDLVMGTYITETTLDVKMEGRKFTFYGETYDLDFQIARLKKLSEVNDNRINDIEYYLYKNENSSFRIVNGSNKLLGLSINEKKGYDASKDVVSLDEARIIADDFMKTYSLAGSLDDYTVTYVVDDTIRFWYTLTIGGYRVREEYYVVGVNKNGEVWFYSDETSGVYDEFIGKVTEEDVERASRGLSPTVPNSYGFSEPFLQIGSDGNLYLSVSCFADEEMWGEEVSFSYDFYSRVYYEE